MALTAEERKYWEDKGFVEGAKVRAVDLSWSGSTSSRKWLRWEGTIVKGARPKTQGISVEFLRKENHFPEIFVYHPTNLELIETPKPAKEPKMPEPKETKSPLYTAVRDILEAKDRETLDARTDAKVSAVLGVLEGPTGFSVGPLGTLSDAIANEAAPAPVAPAQVPWSLDGLVIDPGGEAVGQWGFFWDTVIESALLFGRFGELVDGCHYHLVGGTNWKHFAYIPGFPGADLVAAARSPRGYK